MAHQPGGFHGMPRGGSNAALLPHVESCNRIAKAETFAELAEIIPAWLLAMPPSCASSLSASRLPTRASRPGQKGCPFGRGKRNLPLRGPALAGRGAALDRPISRRNPHGSVSTHEDEFMHTNSTQAFAIKRRHARPPPTQALRGSHLFAPAFASDPGLGRFPTLLLLSFRTNALLSGVFMSRHA